MNLVEELIVAGLTGRPGPAIPGQRFVFVDYDSENEIGVKVLGEGPTAFLALKRGQRDAVGIGQDWSDDPTQWPFFDTLPEEVRNSGDRDMIRFLICLSEGIMAENGWFSLTTKSAYLDARMEEFVPGARCVFAYDAVPPLQDAAFGLYSFEPVTFSPDWRTETVIALAQQVYESEDLEPEEWHEILPILADALQDAGCDDERILNHCRDASVLHQWCYCWVVELALGKGFVAEAEPGAAPDPAT